MFRVHMDIVGPYKEYELYVVTLVDNFSGYLLTRATKSMPTSKVASALLRTVFECFNTVARTVYHDGGSQFTSAEFLSRMNWMHASSVPSSVASSWVNGKVERVHRVLNERVRSASATDLSFGLFKTTIVKATSMFNTAVTRRTGRTPHSLVFSFSPWPYPEVDPVFRPPEESVDTITDADYPDSAPPLPRLRSRRLPAVGEIWLVRRFGKQKKYYRPFLPCRIVQVVSPRVYKVALANLRSTKRVHLHHLKFISPAAVCKLPSASLPAASP
ncbi:hypothetical protein FOZ60_015490 [Perkinsus olseni]|uniref:Integrase catalytic domain-containing protein n=1 Tax=Perkinsus olseni TaxID=32597 RepID=A0A7J6N5W3_PEROL|nr:hypothetical protein FOZ60_015490 [Perkinsus olseni]